jgi:hypothetical protein
MFSLLCVLSLVIKFLGNLWRNLGVIGLVFTVAVLTWVALSSAYFIEPATPNGGNSGDPGKPSEEPDANRRPPDEDKFFIAHKIRKTYPRVAFLEYPAPERTPFHRNNGIVHAIGVLALVALFLIYRKRQDNQAPAPFQRNLSGNPFETLSVNHQPCNNSFYFVAVGVAFWCWVINHDPSEEYSLSDGVEIGLLLGFGYMLWERFNQEEIPKIARMEPAIACAALENPFVTPDFPPPPFPHDVITQSPHAGNNQFLPEMSILARRDPSPLNIEDVITPITPPSPPNSEVCGVNGPCEEHGFRPLLPFSPWEPFHSCGELFESRSPEVDPSKCEESETDLQRPLTEMESFRRHLSQQAEESEIELQRHLAEVDSFRRHLAQQAEVLSQLHGSCKKPEVKHFGLHLSQRHLAEVKSFRRQLSQPAEESETGLQRHSDEMDYLRRHLSQQTEVLSQLHFGRHQSQMSESLSQLRVKSNGETCSESEPCEKPAVRPGRPHSPSIPYYPRENPEYSSPEESSEDESSENEDDFDDWTEDDSETEPTGDG